MRVPLLLVVFLFPLFPLMAGAGQVSERVGKLRSAGVRFVPLTWFERVPATAEVDRLWKDALTQAAVVRPRSLEAALASPPEHVSVALPHHQGELVLDLVRTEIGTEDLQVNASSGAHGDARAGVHYRGMVRGVPGSWAAISLFQGEVMGLVSEGSGQWVVGRMDGRADGLHVVYRDTDLRKAMPFSCGTREPRDAYRPDQLEVSAGARTVRCVRYYWEVNHNVFLDKGSLAATTTYITGLFNQSATLFDDDGIDIQLSELYIWDTPSPYVQSTSHALLDQFGVTRTSFNGDMAHLVGYGGGGGVAWLNTLCNGLTRYRMAYSGINSSYSNVPTYSWSTMVVTHEAGHNLGSSHTHACVWNGNATAIDGCGPTASSSYVEGSCSTGPVPTSAVGGTIMSYCHLLSAGINLNNGFGPQPRAVIINAVNSASCLTICGSTCDAPGNLSVSSLTSVSAQLTWSATGAVSYTLRWKPVAGSTWTEVAGLTGTSHVLGSLSQEVEYEFQLRSHCTAALSGWSASRLFITPPPCVDPYEPNDTRATATPITAPTTVQALIGSIGDADYFTFTLAAEGNIQVSLSNLAADYDLRLLSSTGTQLAISQLGNTTSEYISYVGAPAGTYSLHVYGYAEAHSAIQCYLLNVYIIPVNCGSPSGLSVSGITHQGGTVAWNAVQGAYAYDLRWRSDGSTASTLVEFINADPYELSGLAPATLYHVDVRARCEGVQGGNTSQWSATSFTTSAQSCELAPNIRLAVKVFLDGPYLSAQTSMSDSLRIKGLLPLEEPYTALGYSLSGSAVTTTTVLGNATPGNAVTDWVLVELREAAAPHGVVECRAGLLQRDGDIVAVDGSSALGFCTPAGTYRVAVRHRNHLGVMTGSAMALGAASTSLDLTQGATSTHGTEARREVGSRRTLWAGDSNGDHTVRYTGGENDRDPVLSVIGGSLPTGSTSGYLQEDCNLDGRVRYTGMGNDRDVILITVGGSVPTNTRAEQMP